MIFYTKLFNKTFLYILITVFFVAFPIYSQDYPNKIRGYKVFQTEVSVKSQHDNTSEKKKSGAVIKIGEPELADVSLTSITLEIPAEIEGVSHTGKIDFLTFKDFKINGLEVEIEEYRDAFELKSGEKIILPSPVKLRLGTGQALRGALKELKDSKNEWTVSGRLFVFGKFKKFGFSFRRVIPLDINIKIENPIKNKLAQTDASN